MELKDIEFRKRLPNIISGIVFAMLALYCKGLWVYIFSFISIILLLFTDKAIKVFSLKIKDSGKGKDDASVESRVNVSDGGTGEDSVFIDEK